MAYESVFIISKGKLVPEAPLETQIFEAAQKGDEQAFGVVYDTYFDHIYRFVFFRTSHQETAEDITEEVFIKAHRGLRSFQGGLPKLQGWLYRIARNAVIDHYRKEHETASLDELENLPSYERSALQTLELQADQQMLLNAVHTLPKEQQSVVKLRFLEELEISEIAEILGKSEGNIRIIQFRALQKLRTILGTV